MTAKNRIIEGKNRIKGGKGVKIDSKKSDFIYVLSLIFKETLIKLDKKNMPTSLTLTRSQVSAWSVYLDRRTQTGSTVYSYCIKVTRRDIII